MTSAGAAAPARVGHRARSPGLAGTWTLVRFALRRDRVRLAVWVLAIALSVLASVASFSQTYPTERDRQLRADLIEGNVVMKLFTGPGYGLDDYTYGAMTADEMLPLTALAVALMSIFLVVRNTRTEEETGRAELVRAAVVGRHAAAVATMIVVGAANVVLGLILALGLPLALEGLGAGGSLAFAAAVTGVGFVFAAVALVAAQLTFSGRAAIGLASVAMAALYLLRSVGDMGDGTLTWLSPFGWATEMRAYVDDRWWPLGLSAALTVALGASALRTQARRDVGGGVIADRPGRPRAPGWLGSPLGLALRLQRVSLIAWGAGLAAMAVLYGGLAEGAVSLYEDIDSLDEYLARIGAADPVDQFLSLTTFWMALIASAYAIQATTRLRSEESAVRAEPILATPVGRPRWLASHLTMALVGGIAVLVAIGLGMGTAHAISSGSAAEVPRVVAAAVVYAPALAVFAGAAVAVFGLAPRATGAIWAAFGVIGFLEMFGPLLQLPGWVYDLSPFQHVPQMPVADFSVAPLAILSAIAAALIATGAVAFRRRDIAA